MKRSSKVHCIHTRMDGSPELQPCLETNTTFDTFKQPGAPLEETLIEPLEGALQGTLNPKP